MNQHIKKAQDILQSDYKGKKRVLQIELEGNLLKNYDMAKALVEPAINDEKLLLIHTFLIGLDVISNRYSQGIYGMLAKDIEDINKKNDKLSKEKE